jgi:hypothetical protein
MEINQLTTTNKAVSAINSDLASGQPSPNIGEGYRILEQSQETQANIIKYNMKTKMKRNLIIPKWKNI